MAKNSELCSSWSKTNIKPALTLKPPSAADAGKDGLVVGGTPTFTSPLHYDSGGPGEPGIHFDLFYNPGVGVTHTLLSINVTCDVGSPYQHMIIGRPDGTQWTSPRIPPGTGSFTQSQINHQGFTVLEDCAEFTAAP